MKNKQKSFIVEFLDASKRLENEQRSKLLDPNSSLYQELTRLRTQLEKEYPQQVAPKRMDFHVELIASHENPTDEMLVKRCQELQGLHIQLEQALMGKAVVLRTPYVTGYGVTHITIAYFPKGIPLQHII